MIPVIINGDIQIFLHSLFLKTHRIVIINTWHIESTESSVSVIESILNTSFGAGAANQIKLGIMIRIAISNQRQNRTHIFLASKYLAAFDFYIKINLLFHLQVRHKPAPTASANNARLSSSASQGDKVKCFIRPNLS